MMLKFANTQNYNESRPNTKTPLEEKKRNETKKAVKKTPRLAFNLSIKCVCTFEAIKSSSTMESFYRGHYFSL